MGRCRASALGSLCVCGVNGIVLRIARGYGLEYRCYICSKDCVGHIRAGGEVSFRATMGAVSFLTTRSLGYGRMSVKFCNKRPLLRVRLVGGTMSCTGRIFNRGGMGFGVAAGTALLGVSVTSFLIRGSFGVAVDLSNPQGVRGGGHVFTGDGGKAFSLVVRGVTLVERGCPFFSGGVSFGTIVSLGRGMSYAGRFFLGCSAMGKLGMGKAFVGPIGEGRVLSFSPRLGTVSGCRIFGIFLCTYSDSLFDRCGPALCRDRVTSVGRTVYRECVNMRKCRSVVDPKKRYLPKVRHFFIATSKGFFPYREMSRASRRLYVNSLRRNVGVSGTVGVLGMTSIADERYVRY